MFSFNYLLLLNTIHVMSPYEIIKIKNTKCCHTCSFKLILICTSDVTANTHSTSGNLTSRPTCASVRGEILSIMCTCNKTHTIHSLKAQSYFPFYFKETHSTVYAHKIQNTHIYLRMSASFST